MHMRLQGHSCHSCHSYRCQEVILSLSAEERETLLSFEDRLSVWLRGSSTRGVPLGATGQDAKNFTTEQLVEALRNAKAPGVPTAYTTRCWFFFSETVTYKCKGRLGWAAQLLLMDTGSLVSVLEVANVGSAFDAPCNLGQDSLLKPARARSLFEQVPIVLSSVRLMRASSPRTRDSTSWPCAQRSSFSGVRGCCMGLTEAPAKGVNKSGARSESMP